MHMKKNYGVWGLGVVGKSVLEFLYKHKAQFAIDKLSVMDKRQPNDEEAHFLQQHGIAYVSEAHLHQFFASHDIVIPSPGVDITEAANYKDKLVEELDLFCDSWQKPLIAVTGTLGKTSVVHLLDKILQHNGVNVATGGNIGTGMLDLLGLKEKANMALLEVSSFQLERTKRFAPDIAILTNLYPNHLDRHGTMEHYLLAKYHIMMHQHEGQYALVPWEMRNRLRILTSRPLMYFSVQPVHEIAELRPQDTLYTLRNNALYKVTTTTEVLLFSLDAIPAISYLENWIIILAACDVLGILKKETFSIPSLDLPTHRLEKVATFKNIDFYNDSKSTIFEATLSAVNHLSPARIHLFLGGISKGVNRAELLEKLKDKVASVSCFGGEADQLYTACLAVKIPAYKHATLEQAFAACVTHAQAKDVILFSPAGASYDLYKNYKERGDEFVRLVKNLQR